MPEDRWCEQAQEISNTVLQVSSRLATIRPPGRVSRSRDEACKGETRSGLSERSPDEGEAYSKKKKGES